MNFSFKTLIKKEMVDVNARTHIIFVMLSCYLSFTVPHNVTITVRFAAL